MGFPTVGMCDQQSLRSACACAQSDRGLCLPLECYVTIGLLPGCRLGSEPGVRWVWGGLCGLVWVCACRNATLLEVTCHGSRFHYSILLYICALEIFAVKTTSLSKVLLLFSPFFVFRAPTCQQDVITLHLKLCRTVFLPLIL